MAFDLPCADRCPAVQAAIERHARDILKTREQLNRILAERTGQPLEKIERDTERDYYLSAAESAEYGLIDKVIERRPTAG